MHVVEMEACKHMEEELGTCTCMEVAVTYTCKHMEGVVKEMEEEETCKHMEDMVTHGHRVDDAGAYRHREVAETCKCMEAVEVVTYSHEA